MKVVLPLIPLLGLAGLMGVGCAPEKPKARAGVLDVSVKPAVDDVAPTGGYAPAPQGYAAAPAYQPQPAYQPAYQPAPPAARQPIAVVASTDDVPVRPATASYTVQKGDTLFGIAKTHYGDGNKWKRIASANPGLTPSSLRVGQKIVVPQ